MRKIFFGLIFIGFVFSSFNKNYRGGSTDIKLNNQIEEVKGLINSNSKYNKEIAFFIDMEIQSGKNRFFVYDLKNDKIIDEGLVAHGSGSETGIPGKLKFSNINNSRCTSLGKYSIGNHYYGQYGKSYRLYGLDKTNSNAFGRSIVLHEFWAVPYEEQDRNICNSYGCPMVNEKYFERIEKIIDNSKTNIILSIYY
ncbi:murein L,D-transpeptidase catalytic domain-containing protein [Flavobacterium aestivum]|uniref:murein L,D-transpeptidase catalytic domain-containing protein n=1 Tax=Flavobacterium aestivum TaxID=3003257 RepID=UPI0022853DA8|nr:murein L,D-transpeptidase catalytic domain family protein [Flavobacterium aestivum]